MSGGSIEADGNPGQSARLRAEQGDLGLVIVDYLQLMSILTCRESGEGDEPVLPDVTQTPV
jgi:hypothetical protein